MKEQWGKLTEDDLAVIKGKQDQLVGQVQERYGIARDEAERQVKEWRTVWWIRLGGRGSGGANASAATAFSERSVDHVGPG